MYLLITGKINPLATTHEKQFCCSNHLGLEFFLFPVLEKMFAL